VNMRNIHSHDYGTMFVVYFLQLQLIILIVYYYHLSISAITIATI